MNVLYDSQIFQGQRYGGVSRYFHELISHAVRSQTLDVSLFLGLSQNGYGTESLAPHCKHFFGVAHPELRKLVRFARVLNPIMLKTFAWQAKPDLFHPTYYFPYLGRSRVPRVLTVHDMIHERFPNMFYSRDQTSRLKALAVSRAQQIIAVSHSTKRDLVDLFQVPPERVSVVHLGGPTVLRSPPKPQGLDDFILYVGVRASYRNFALLATAFALAKESRDTLLVCYGGGPFRRSESELFHKLKIEHRVVHRAGPDDDLACYYAHAIALVFPSLYEGFGIPPLEAMAYGCPVVVSRTSSVPEVVGAAGLYFDPSSVEECCAQLQRVLSDNQLRADLSAKGLLQSRKFSWQRCFDETLAVYTAVV